MSTTKEKTVALLRFLKQAATLRRKRIAAYGRDTKVLWLADVPQGLPQNWKDACRSAFISAKPDDIPDLWLEVRKKRRPTFPDLPDELKEWVPQKFQDNPEEYVHKKIDELLDILNPQITVIVEKRVSEPNASSGEPRILTEKVPEVRHLENYPEVEEAWLDYLISRWEPWAAEMRWWRQVQDLYEKVDFMRRRLEEAEERYELLLGVGLLQWRDSTGKTVKRHLLVAPAEISLDAARGVLTVSPAASFEKFHVELDMLELQDRPHLEGTQLDDLLEDLDVQAWDKAKVAQILRIIANRASPDAQVDEDAWKPFERSDETFRVSYAPALVLRERRPTAYEELIDRFLDASENGVAFSVTAPWERFISEGKTPEPVVNKASDGSYPVDDEDHHLYFPLPTNEEQRQIAERLKTRPHVLVKGPPGTGKSHTIANLICHLLATGERVLVTAHAPKALTVLWHLLPRNIRDLCVTAFGSTREDHRLLENSVRGILSQKNKWKGEEWTEREITRLEKELDQLEREAIRVDRQLRECREAETHSHTLPGDYTGTAAQIAREIEKQRDMYSWFPELLGPKKACPLESKDVQFFAEFHTALTEERANELDLDVGAFPLPNPEEFKEAINKLSSAEAVAKTALDGISAEQVNTLQRVPSEQLVTLRTFLAKLEEEVARSNRVLDSDFVDEILKDLLLGQDVRWKRLAQEAAGLVREIQEVRPRVGTAQVDVPTDIPEAKMLADTRRRLDHFRAGRWRGWGWIAPRIVRQTRYIEKHCRVDGEAPRNQDSLDILLGFLELKEFVECFCDIWPTQFSSKFVDPRRLADELCDKFQYFCRLFEFFKDHGQETLHVIPVQNRIALADPKERLAWHRLIDAELARRQAVQARKPFEKWLSAIKELPYENAHPCMAELAQAIEERNPEKWSNAWAMREKLKEEKRRLRRYQELFGAVVEASPELANFLQSTRGNLEWTERLRQFRQAWHWAAAKAWLRKVSDPEHYERLLKKRHVLQKEIETKVEKLASLKAWLSFFKRLNDQTTQHLIAWTKAVARIGKGTGRFAYRHRKTAREYLISCIPKMPAWIMPLHKLWETTEPRPGVFDTIIVDEASQAGIEALPLLLLAKRIIVVGDDKQNSPEAVGVLEDDIARLAREHLGDFQFRNEFRPDASLYDHAERAFGNVISLREHFRCVPEIIRFSNELCYSDAPLIPLRQPPPDRLPPLKAKFVEHGVCEGSGQRIVNRAEAEEIVNTIQACLCDPAYEDKTMGVIVLQGHAQAEFIEKRLAELLEPKVREERKLRCGVPATFQGDERDVIFLSLVVASNHHFRALTGLSDQRRFNVAMSRARDQVWLFHSVQRHELNREDLRWRLLNFFYNPSRTELEKTYEELDRLERETKRRSRHPGEQPDPYESWFEVDVALELLRRKYRIRPQVEVAGFRIDIVIEGLTNRLAVECDGEAWHGPERFENDMARQRQLERAGWTFVRIRESEFYVDRESSIRRIIEACEELGIRPIGEDELELDEDPTTNALADKTGSQDHKATEDEAQPDANHEKVPRKTREDQTASPPTAYLAGFPDPRTASPINVRATLRQIIEREGPLTKRLLVRLYVEGCPTLHRASKSVRSLLNQILYKMQKTGEIIVEDELGDRSLESQVLRLAGSPRVRERPAGHRDLLEIPPSEIFLAIERIMSKSEHNVYNEDELMRKLIEHYGFKRLTQVRRRHLKKVFEIYRGRP